MVSAHELQRKFGIPGIVIMSERSPLYTVVHVQNEFATASMALHGAQVLTFQPREHKPVIWLSRDAVYKESKAIRGGIPICWPWFGAHPGGTLPAHGFVRNRFWQLESIDHIPGSYTRVVMTIRDDERTDSIWPHRFELRLEVLVGHELSLSLTMINPGASTFEVTSALHSYFSVADVSRTSITGLEGVEYIDQLRDNAHQVQTGPIAFEGELDRVYQHTDAKIMIHDVGRKRQICIEKTGSQSTVVWNPWIGKSEAMDDFERGGYKAMVCVETSNAGENKIRLPSESSHTLGTVISVKENEICL